MSNGDTVPTGKTQEEADTEMSDDERREELERLTAANNTLRHKAVELEASLTIANNKIVSLREELTADQMLLGEHIESNLLKNRVIRDLRFELTEARVQKPRLSIVVPTVLMMIICIGTLGASVGVYNNVIRQLAALAPPAPECPVCEAAPVVPETPLASAPTSDGYMVDGEYGVGILMPWPDASHYPSAVFVDDCRAVCAAPAPLGDEPGRVLVVDPEHLLCICFHADTTWPVTRWINWELVR